MLAGFRFKLAIELHRIFVNLAHRIGQVEERQQARGMPGGARGEFLALHRDKLFASPVWPITKELSALTSSRSKTGTGAPAIAAVAAMAIMVGSSPARWG